MALRDIMAEGLRRGWHAEIMAPGDGALIDYCTHVGIRRHSLPIVNYTSGFKKISEVLRYGIDMARAAKAIGSIVSQSRIDLVVANGPRVMAAVATVRRPVVFHLHSRLDKRYASTIVRWGVRRSNRCDQHGKLIKILSGFHWS